MATHDRAGNAYGSPAKAKTNAERAGYSMSNDGLRSQALQRESAKFKQSSLQNRLSKDSGGDFTPLGEVSKSDVKYGTTKRQEMEGEFRTARREEKAASRRFNDIAKNTQKSMGVIPLGKGY